MNLPATAQSKVCKRCDTNKPLAEFDKSTSNKDGRGSYCLPCAAERRRIARSKTPEYYKRQQIKHKYGLEPHEYDAMLEATPHCPICGSEEPLVVDHDHSTSTVRGLICNHCNLVLGHAKDNIETLKNAIKYLEQ